MTKFYLKLIILLFITFIALVVSARMVGGTQPTHPALRGFTEGCEGKPQPCWYGIVPGATTGEEADIILTRRGYSVPTRNADSYSLVLDYQLDKLCQCQLPEWIQISPEGGENDYLSRPIRRLEILQPYSPVFSFGDLIVVFGLPVVFGSPYYADENLAQAFWGDDENIDAFINGYSYGYNSLYLPVSRLSLYHSIDAAHNTHAEETSQKWYGTVPRWRYWQVYLWNAERIGQQIQIRHLAFQLLSSGLSFTASMASSALKSGLSKIINLSSRPSGVPTLAPY